MDQFTELELIKLLLLLEDMEELISHVLQPILVLEMVVVLSSELDYLWKIWNLFNSILLVFMDQDV
jgi:hypothetical protein